MNGFGVGVVVKSEDDRWKEGELCTGMFGWQQYVLMTANDLQRVRSADDPLHVSLFKLVSRRQRHFGTNRLFWLNSNWISFKKRYCFNFVRCWGSWNLCCSICEVNGLQSYWYCRK